jgi:hypothetical protein
MKPVDCGQTGTTCLFWVHFLALYEIVMLYMCLCMPADGRPSLHGVGGIAWIVEAAPMQAMQRICDVWNSQGCDQDVILMGVTPCGLVDPFPLFRATRCLNHQRKRLNSFLRVEVLGAFAFAMQTRLATTDRPVECVRPFFWYLTRARLVLHEFSWNFLFWVFTNICQHIQILLKVIQNLAGTSHG